MVRQLHCPYLPHLCRTLGVAGAAGNSSIRSLEFHQIVSATVGSDYRASISTRLATDLRECVNNCISIGCSMECKDTHRRALLVAICILDIFGATYGPQGPRFADHKTLFCKDSMNRKFAPRCQVCRHDERWRIELLKAGGASLDSLAEKFNLQRDAIFRHWRDHVSDELKASYLAGPTQLQGLAEKAAETGSSVLDNLHAVRVVLWGALSSMTEAGDGRGQAYIAGRLTATLETIARVSGELGAMANSITINNTNVHVLEHPAFLRVQATILRALASHPDARAAVVLALRGLEPESPPPGSAMKVIEHHAA